MSGRSAGSGRREKAEEGTRREITNSSANADAAAAFEENFHGALSVWRQRKPPDKNRRSRGIKGRDRLRERERESGSGWSREGREAEQCHVRTPVLVPAVTTLVHYVGTENHRHSVKSSTKSGMLARNA